MRVVVDTNTVVSAYLWAGPPAGVLDLHACGWIEIYTCREQLDELGAVLHRPKFAARLLAGGLTAAAVLRHFADQKHIVPTEAVSASAVRDPGDAWVLGCAAAANAHAIVSGDNDLHQPSVLRQRPVFRAAEFIAFYRWARNR